MAKCIKDAEPRWAKNSNNCNGKSIHGTPVTRNMKDGGVGLKERMESKLRYSSLWMQVLCTKTGQLDDANCGLVTLYFKWSSTELDLHDKFSYFFYFRVTRLPRL